MLRNTRPWQFVKMSTLSNYYINPPSSCVPSQVAFKSTKTAWDWYEEPGNEYRLTRYNSAMDGSTKADPPNAILQGEDLTSLSEPWK